MKNESASLEENLQLIQEVMSLKTLQDAKMERQIFKLENEEDWPYWKKTVLTVFGTYGILNLVCSDDGLYEDPLEALDNLTEKELKLFNEEYNDNVRRPATKIKLKIYYKEIMKIAYSTIFLCLSKKYGKQTFSLKHGQARELWEKLVSLFERKTASSLRRLKQEFLQCHQEEDEPVAEFCERLRTIADQLNELEEDYDDTDVMQAIFTGVIDDYYPVVDILEHDNTITLDRAVERIRDFELKLKNRSLRGRRAGRSRTDDSFNVN